MDPPAISSPTWPGDPTDPTSAASFPTNMGMVCPMSDDDGNRRMKVPSTLNLRPVFNPTRVTQSA